MKAFLIGLTVCLVLPGFLAQEYYQMEEQLLASLKNNYSVEARPHKKTVVTSSLMLFSLNKLEIGKEEMSVSGEITNRWHDPRLTWDPTVKDISSVVARATDIWIPPLIIENNVEKVEMLDRKTPLRIVYDGSVMWATPISSTTSCEGDITFYPYDKQTCNITLVGWTYTMDEVQLVARPNLTVDTNHYTANGEWELMGTGYNYFDLEANTGFTYRKLKFLASFRRKWPYYGQNVMLPVVLNSFLMAIVFALPIDSGEKMGYCLTVLLSYFVLLTMVSASLPSISNQTSIIQVYLSLVMCLGTLAIICTIGVLRLYHRDEEKNPVPGWMQTIARSILTPVVYRTCRKSRRVLHETKMKKGYIAKDIAEMLDSFFFMIFTLAMISITITIIAILVIQYYMI